MFERASVRLNPRVPVRVEIGRAGQGTTVGVVSNISDHGACVVTDAEFPIGESLVLHLVFSPEAQPFQAAGRVVWMRPGDDISGAQRYGLQWAHKTGPQHARLRELISERL